MISPSLSVDFLIETARNAARCHGWVDEELVDVLDHDHDRIESQTDALAERVTALRHAVAEFTYYHDGRPVVGRAVVDDAVHIEHVFAAAPARGERLLFTADRPADPDAPPRGHYRVYVNDTAATLRVEVYGPLDVTL